MESTQSAMQGFIASFVVGVIAGSVTVGTIAYCLRKRAKKFPHLEYGSDSMTRSEHCQRCLCNNPVLSKMLLERSARQTGDVNTQTSKREVSIDEIRNSNGTFDFAIDWTTFDDATYNAEVEIDVSNESKYDADFLERCRDPEFLHAQLKKIEDEYKLKMEKLERNRVNEIAKKEAQYKKIKAEVLNDNFFQ